MHASLSSFSLARPLPFSSCEVPEATSRPNADYPITPSELQQMPFPVFARTVVDLLEALGYEQVSFMKPMHLRGKGRNAHGGYDIRAFLSSKLNRSMVIVQLKQYQRPLPRLGVDELRGTMVRVGARQGLLVTTSTISAAARDAVQAGQYASPVRLIDGLELANLLRENRDDVPQAQPKTNRSIVPPTPSKTVLRSGCEDPFLTVRVDVALSPARRGKPRW